MLKCCQVVGELQGADDQAGDERCFLFMELLCYYLLHGSTVLRCDALRSHC